MPRYLWRESYGLPDAREFRQARPDGSIMSLPALGGLRHHYIGGWIELSVSRLRGFKRSSPLCVSFRIKRLFPGSADFGNRSKNGY
jgi:hypothetical protein